MIGSFRNLTKQSTHFIIHTRQTQIVENRINHDIVVEDDSPPPRSSDSAGTRPFVVGPACEADIRLDVTTRQIYTINNAIEVFMLGLIVIQFK